MICQLHPSTTSETGELRPLPPGSLLVSGPSPLLVQAVAGRHLPVQVYPGPPAWARAEVPV